MPKVRPLTESMRRAERYRRQDEQITRQFGRLQGEAKLSQEKIARRLGWSEPTLRKRITHPENLTLGHLRQLEELFESEGVPFHIEIGEEEGCAREAAGRHRSA